MELAYATFGHTSLAETSYMAKHDSCLGSYALSKGRQASYMAIVNTKGKQCIPLHLINHHMPLAVFL